MLLYPLITKKESLLKTIFNKNPILKENYLNMKKSGKTLFEKYLSSEDF